MNHDRELQLSTQATRRKFLCASAIGLASGWTSELRAQLLRSKHVSWLDEIQRAPKTLPANAPRLRSIAAKTLESVEAWEPLRKRIRESWLDFLGPLSRTERTLPKIEVTKEDRLEKVTRQLLRYQVEEGEEVHAYLLRPRQGTGRLRAVAVFHSTVPQSLRQPAGVEGRAQLAFGLELARRGFVTICPRNYLWRTGKLEAQEEARRFHQRHPDSRGMARMLYDAQIAVDILVARPDVDPKRIGAVGHSLGAKEVLYLAAFDQRVRATVSSEGGIGTRFSNWDAPWYLGKTIKEKTFLHEHHELLALVAPRAFLLVGGESADGDRSWPFIEAVLPIYRLYGQQDDPARVGHFNHRQGHAVPKEAERRMLEWLATYL